MTLTVDQLVAQHWPGRARSVEPLPGGITNANFLVDLGDERVVLRLAGTNTKALGIDWKAESAATRLASSIGVAPELLARSDHEGWMVTRFIDGRTLTVGELGEDPMLELVASTLQRVHRAGSIDAIFDPYAIVRRYHDVAAYEGVQEPFDYPRACSVMQRIQDVHPFRATSFCHNDLLNANFLFDGTLRILDWEYAGMGDPYFDLANFSINHDFTSRSDEVLLTHYFAACRAASLATLELMKVVSELRESMWGVVQLATSTLDVDFLDYSEQRARRFESLLEAMDLDEVLQAVALH